MDWIRKVFTRRYEREGVMEWNGKVVVVGQWDYYWDGMGWYTGYWYYIIFGYTKLLTYLSFLIVNIYICCCCR